MIRKIRDGMTAQFVVDGELSEPQAVISDPAGMQACSVALFSSGGNSCLGNLTGYHDRRSSSTKRGWSSV